jgi:hypothetical protein
MGLASAGGLLKLFVRDLLEVCADKTDVAG